MDPTVLPAVPAKGLTKQSGGEGEGEGEACPNETCRDDVQVFLFDPFVNWFTGAETGNTLEVRRVDTGESLPLMEWLTLKAGTELQLTARANPDKGFKFMEWSVVGDEGKGTIHGSREPLETWYVVPDEEGESGFVVFPGFTRNRVVIPLDNGVYAYGVSGAAAMELIDDGSKRHYWIHPDATATLSATYVAGDSVSPMWNLDQCSGCASPSHNRSSRAMVKSVGYAHAIPTSPGESRRTVHLLASAGGELYGSANPYNIGRVVNSVTSTPAGAIRLDAAAGPGYTFAGYSIQGPSPFRLAPAASGSQSTTYISAGANVLAAALFEEKEEYVLTATPEGDDVPCSGYIRVSPAQKYYPAGSPVALTAVASPGYLFSHWDGGGTTTYGDGVYGHTSEEIAIAMNGDREVTAVLVKEHTSAPAEAFDLDACCYCIHGGYPNDRDPVTNAPAEAGYLIGDVPFGPLTAGLARYSDNRDTALGGDDWGCAYYIHKKLKDIGAAWIADNPGKSVSFNDISRHGGGPGLGHASHRNGLDVDIAYQSTIALSNTLIAEIVGDSDCELVYAAGTGIDIGGKVRFDADHTGHFHVRFVDPDGLPPEN